MAHLLLIFINILNIFINICNCQYFFVSLHDFVCSVQKKIYGQTYITIKINKL